MDNIESIKTKLSFRKNVAEEMKSKYTTTFRKSIDLRVSTPLRENHLERRPSEDTLLKH
jgi:hypothetical protein